MQKTTESTGVAINRRSFVKSAAALAVGTSLLQTSTIVRASAGSQALSNAIGPLLPADANGVRLPQGFSSRIVAQTGRQVCPQSPYRWHVFPDGGATYPTIDKGWIYVSNSEIPLVGGVGAMRFNRRGDIVDSYRILDHTNTNCAGGPTPWYTWLSCEEIAYGRVFECDPYGRRSPVARPALGLFKHEAVAVDPINMQLYLTEDESDGRLYRFTPRKVFFGLVPDLREGLLEVAVVDPETGMVGWRGLPNPMPRKWLFETETRYQIEEATVFRGGEGIWYHEGKVFFTTKGDNKVWELEISTQQLTTIYDAATAADPMLTGVDNVTVSERGSVLIAEDGGDMQIVVISPEGETVPIMQIEGQDDSEITGPAFSPDGSRLYFSSQRGPAGLFGTLPLGLTYEISGPFGQVL